MNKSLYHIVELAAPHSAVAIPRKPVFQLESGAPGLKRPDQKPGWIAGLVSLLLMAMSAQAATWYVDNTAGGSNNGTSWANAWTSIGGIQGVGAGDTVNFSGGASSSSQTYAITNWTPKGGTSGNPVTYAVGQDASHNGTVIFSGYPFIAGSPQWVTLNGNDGKGNRHMVSTGTVITTNTCVGLKLLYMTVNGNINLELGPTQYEIGWCQVNCPDGGNCAIYLPADYQEPSGFKEQFGVNKIHDSFINAWRGSGGAGAGDDFIDWGNSCSVYNNYFKGLACDGTTQTYAGGGSAGSQSSYTGGNHQDGWQVAGNYNQFYGNTCENCANSSVYLDFTSSIDHFYLYNNVCFLSDPAFDPAQNSTCGFTFNADSGNSNSTLTNIFIANNTFADYNYRAVDLGGSSAAGVTTYGTGCVCANNLFIGAGEGFTPAGTGTVKGSFTLTNNLALTSAQGTKETVSFSPWTTGPNFHILSADSNIIGQGSSTPSTIFTTDKDGNPQPASAWSIGAYVYNNSNSPLAPTDLVHLP